ncbi:MAG: ADP-ribosylglycohydrolase family protein [Verrucomicrobiales bacterium]|nr:ADP-ribosylglycohydrolase family protein [Verrucomicrobiales bacterium]MCP5556401.1 ADP-ribosylglycohydrolase family protein [Verrucomicrobiaceae bacterium]
MNSSGFIDRAAAAIWGQFIGDAAALGTHWIYDLEALNSRHPDGIHGFESPAPDHYHGAKQSGDQTHYGDAALLILESVAERGQFDEVDFGQRFVAFFADPACQSYKDKATRGTLENLATRPGDFQNGADDDQLATVTRLAPVVVAHQPDGDEGFFDAVRRATLFAQQNAIALSCTAAHAELLRSLLMGVTLPEAFEHARRSPDVSCDMADYFEAAHTQLQLDVVAATEFFGQSCPLRQSFPAALHAALKHADDFQHAILQTVRAGGDNAGRAALVGTWLGAAGGMAVIPEAWQQKLTARDRIAAAIQRLTA